MKSTIQRCIKEIDPEKRKIKRSWVTPLTYIFKYTNKKMIVINSSDKISLIADITHLSAHADTSESSSSTDQPNEAIIKERVLDINCRIPPKPMDEKKLLRNQIQKETLEKYHPQTPSHQRDNRQITQKLQPPPKGTRIRQLHTEIKVKKEAKENTTLISHPT